MTGATVRKVFGSLLRKIQWDSDLLVAAGTVAGVTETQSALQDR
jgi:hypothetical protein